MIPISLRLATRPGLRASDAGVFVSPGHGRHPDRVIDSWELIVVERGRLGLAVDEASHELGAGDWVLMPAGVRHRGTAPYPRDLRFVWLHFHPDTARDGRLALPAHGRLEDPGAISGLARRLIDHRAAAERAPLVEELLLALVLAEIAAAPPALDAAQDLAARAQRLVRARFREDISTNEVASALGVSADHLGRCFRRAYKRTVVDAINQERLREARRLMLLGGGKITDVARSAGFPDAQWFRRLFTRAEGVSPLRWRRLHARVHTNTA
jgi:AraC-like DNA-binding protein